MQDFQASKASKFLIFLVILSIISVFAVSFLKYFVNKDFLLYIKQACDPQIEKCFVQECEPDDIRCSSYPEGKFYYKIVINKQKDLLNCSGKDCAAITCEPNEEFCTVYLCSESNLEKFDLPDTCS